MVMVAENEAKITCYPMQFPTMASVDNIVPRNLKFKLICRGSWDASEDKSRENNVKGIVNNGQRERVSGGRSKRSEVNLSVKPCPSMPVNSGKRRPEMSLDGPRGKKQKLNRNLKLQFRKILKELMNHRAGWIFSQPVDPVKLEIPDYFSVITKPMDLGTIQCKLEGNMYSGADEFADDVRLTFSNAMLYNPPGNKVHELAKTLDGTFSRQWKSLDAKLKLGNKNDEEASFIDYMGNKAQDTKRIVENNHQNMKPIGLSKDPLCVKAGTSKLMTLEDKQKFRLELVQVLSRKMTDKLRTVFQKFGLTGLHKERLDSYIDLTDDETLWNLRREVKALLVTRDGKVKPGRVAMDGCSPLKKTVEKEHCSRSALASAESVNHNQSLDSTQAKCYSCVSLKCHCLRNGASQESASDLSSERSSEHNHYGESKPDCEVKYSLAYLTNSRGLDSDGPGVVVNEENSPCLSTIATTPASVEGGTFSVRMSPKKALRAAMLKSRFADTIFRATLQVHLDHGEKLDPSRMQQEIERLEREQLEEKARIEAQIKAAEAASRRREQDDLKMRRERERKAARTALEKMEESVKIDENVGVLKDLEMLGLGSLFYPHDGKHLPNPLEQFSLYIKDDFMEEDDPILIGEEGEIL